MSQRVTRSSAARLANSPLPESINSPTPNSNTTTRKRKATAIDETVQTSQPPKDSRRKKAKVEASEQQAEPSPLHSSPPKRSRPRRTATTMSSAGQSSNNSAETSPQGVPRDSKKKSTSRRNKEEQSSSAAQGSRKLRRGSRKDHDTIMKDSDTNAEPAEATTSRRDTGTGAGAGEGAEESLRRLTEDVMAGDPFTGGYLSQLVGRSGLAGLSGHLRALSGMSSGMSSRLRGILEQLKAKDDQSTQLIALQELSELLLVSNEDNLAGQFAPDHFVKELVTLMQPNEFTEEENPEIMLLACRCIANLMEALPAATASVVYGGAVPILCQKLLEIHFIDLAEQALSTLEKISVEFPASIVREGGLTACLTYLDFFATSTQRTAVTTAANCCRNIPEESFPTVRDVMPILLNTLSSNDQRVVESASLCVSRIIDSFKYTESKLEELVSADLLRAILRLLLPSSTNMISPNIHTSFLRVLSITARASSRLSAELLKMNVVDTLYQILVGVSPPTNEELDTPSRIDKNVIMQAIIRTPREQVFETLNVISEILPTVSRDDLMFLDDLEDSGLNAVSMSTRSKKSPNDKRLELLKACPAEVKRFTVILFPTLMYAYTSTVNLAVRQKVLTAQLKMLSNFDTDILQQALRGVAYSSHLASIMSQQDNPMLVTYALQSAELLLKRLEVIYRPQFYREGVTAEIEKLANRPLQAELEAKHKESEIEEPHTVTPDIARASDIMDLDAPAAMHETAGDTEPDNDDEDDENEEDITHDVDEDDEDDNEDHSDESGSSDRDPRAQLANVQDVITCRAKRFIEVHQPDTSQNLQTQATAILDDLHNLAEQLGSNDGKTLFLRLAKYFTEDALQSITSYELMTSGIVDKLLIIMNDSDLATRSAVRRDFVEVFMSQESTQSEHMTAFSILVRKLQELLSRNEHFEVLTVNQNAFETNRMGAASMLAKQLRIELISHDDAIPKAYRRLTVSTHAIATLKALDDYLRPRLSILETSGRDRSIPGSLAAYTAAMTGQPPILDNHGSSLPTRGTTSKKARHKSRPESEDQAAATPRPSSGPDPAAVASGLTSSQEQLECADETRISDDDHDAEADLDALVDTMTEEVLDNEAEPSAVNMEIGNTGKVSARTDDGKRINTPQSGTLTPAVNHDRLMQAHARLAAARELLSTPSGSRGMSYASALQSTPQDWHIEFSMNGQRLANDMTIYRACYSNQAHSDGSTGRGLWNTVHTITYKRVDGPPVDAQSLTASIENISFDDKADLPPSLTEHPMTARILRLMSILHELNSNIDEIIPEKKSELIVEPLTRFVNSKLTAKLNRQLEEPLIVASNCLPTWAEDLSRIYPFLFPFETRHLFLSSTSFGYSRSMTRWQNAQSEDSRRGRHRDERQFLGRLKRQKVRIARHKILESAVKVLEIYGSSPAILEVEYFEEVGTGLGPTLEFFSSVSREFSRKKTKLWRENDSQADGDYAFGRKGLFPAPMTDESSKSESSQRVIHLFTMLGKFVARAMLDSRIIDISFNPAFFRFIREDKDLTIANVASVDQDLARSLKILKKYDDARQRIQNDDQLDKASKARKIEDIRINDAKLEDLALDFTLPGYERLELVEDGGNVAVTVSNVASYIDKVVDLTLGSGVRKQLKAFATGFSQVFPYEALRAFTPDELVMLFGRNKEDWTLETLMDSIKADHGYNLDSKSVRNLLHVMSELASEEKRAFLQFVTGSPKLPIGGFKSLTPMLTVVCKPAESPLTSDDYLPSVMTCVNYLKMPDYSTIEVLKARLHTAVKEGQGSFHLS